MPAISIVSPAEQAALHHTRCRQDIIAQFPLPAINSVFAVQQQEAALHAQTDRSAELGSCLFQLGNPRKLL